MCFMNKAQNILRAAEEKHVNREKRRSRNFSSLMWLLIVMSSKPKALLRNRTGIKQESS